MKEIREELDQVQSELRDLHRTAERLSLSVANLKEKLATPPIEPERPTPAPVPPVGKTRPPAQEKTATPPPLPRPTAPMAAPEPAEEPHPQSRDLELQLGRVWSVRLGIVLLTTGFIFLSHYTYDAVIRDLGPGIRLSLLYVLSFALTGAGLFFERWNDTLKSYGRVVAAGGLAAIYYCGYAAYHVESLKVIESPVVASLLLLVSAGLFCGMSLWRNSRTMLSASLALAFYSVAMNPVGWMGCFSALVLSTFGIAMMVRHRWAEVGFLVLCGSYLSFLWWQYASPFDSGGHGHWYLPAYWLLFAAASLVPGRLSNPDQHLVFSSINNAAFFLLFSFRFETGQWMAHHDLFCFAFGGILVTLSRLARERFPDSSRRVHFVKGVGLITLGFAILLDGYQLFLVLLVEAIVIMAANLKRSNQASVATSWGVALLSLLPLTRVMGSEVHPAIWIMGAAAWMVFGILHRAVEQGEDDLAFSPGALLASIVSLLIIYLGLMPGWDPWHQATTMGWMGAAAALLMLVPFFVKRMPEGLFIWLAAGFVGLFMASLVEPGSGPVQWWIGAAIALWCSVPLALSSVKSKVERLASCFNLSAALYLALSLFLIWRSLEQADLDPMLRLAIDLGIPILGTLVGRWSGLRLYVQLPFAMHLVVIHRALSTFALPEANACLLGFGMIVVHFALVQLSPRLEDRGELRIALSVLAALFWSALLITGLESPAVAFALSAVVFLVVGPRYHRKLAYLVAVPYMILGLAFATFSGSSFEVYLTLIPILALHLIRSFRQSGSPLTPLAVLGLLVLWSQITVDAGNVPLAAAWAILGTLLLLTGLGLKSRPFRLIGLIVLAFSLGHLMIFDVIKLDPLPRILSFMTLGIGLLGLGFVYNRWQDRLKQIL